MTNFMHGALSIGANSMVDICQSHSWPTDLPGSCLCCLSASYFQIVLSLRFAG